MANRYSRASKGIDKATNNRIYNSVLYPQINPANSDIVIFVKEGTNRLDLLAHKYYGNPNLWWIISQANNLSGDTFFIPTGQKIRIPSDIETIIRDMDELNNTR